MSSPYKERPFEHIGLVDGKEPTQEQAKEKAKEMARQDLADLSQNPNEFVLEIYAEALNSQQDPDARVSKVLAKCSGLFISLVKQQDEISKKNLKIANLALITAIFSIVAVAIIGGIQIYLQFIDLSIKLKTH